MRRPQGVTRVGRKLRAAGVAACVGAAILGACTETRRSNGEECLKDEDCLSGLCSALRCVALPPILDATAPATDAAAHDASDASDSAPADADAAVDAPIDATADAADAGDAEADGADGAGSDDAAGDG